MTKNEFGFDYATLVVNRMTPRPVMIRLNQERDPLLKVFFEFFRLPFVKVADFGGKEIWGNTEKGISVVAESSKIIVSFLGAWWIRRKAFFILKTFLLILERQKIASKVSDYYFSRLDIKLDVEEVSPLFLFGTGEGFGKFLRFKKFSKNTAFYPVQIYGTNPYFISRASIFNSRFQFQIYKKSGQAGEQNLEEHESKKKFYSNKFKGKEICRIELKLKYADTLKKYLNLFRHMEQPELAHTIFCEWAKKNEFQIVIDGKWAAHPIFRRLFYHDASS